MSRFHEVAADLPAARGANETQCLLIGAYFTQLFAFKSTVLFNPSVVRHPDQAGLDGGDVRIVVSLRGIGEGHVSTLAFRAGATATSCHSATRAGRRRSRKHGVDWLLWDAGLGDEIAATPTGRVVAGLHFRVPRTLASQLAALGVRPDDIRYVGLSHLHADHSGNAAMFPRATFLVCPSELAWASAWPTPEGVAPDRVAAVSASKVEPVPADKDVFGDGSVRMVSTPGHTVGHHSLMVHLPRAGWVILTGDVAHFVVLAGLTTDICLFWAAADAQKLGYNVMVVADACGTMTTLGDTSTYGRLRDLGIVVTVTNQVVTELQGNFGTSQGQQAQGIMYDEIISNLS